VIHIDEIRYQVGSTPYRFYIRYQIDQEEPYFANLTIHYDNLPTKDGTAKHYFYDLTGQGTQGNAWVLMGSESYGFWTSDTVPAENWMQKSYDIIGDRKLIDVVMPGTHDAGTGTLVCIADLFEQGL
jgi:hypothetical protein